MDAGGVQVQHQPSTQDVTRQPWKNNSNSTGDQDRNSNENVPVSLKSNVERAQGLDTVPRTAVNTNSIKNFITPRAVQQQMFLSRPSSSLNGNSSVSASKQQLRKTTIQQKTTGNNRPTPKPLDLSNSSQVQNLGRIPKTATFPPKVNRALNLPNPPKTATSSGFPKDIRQALRIPTSSAFTHGEKYFQAFEHARLRHYSSNPALSRFMQPNYHQIELGLSTPTLVLSQPDDTDSQESSPSTTGFLSPEGLTGADVCYPHTMQQQFEDESEDHYYHEYLLHQRRTNTIPLTPKEGKRRSVFNGPMKVHPEAVLPIRQPKGPDVTKNFATRIRRKAVNKLYAAAAERRSKSSADRRKSAIF